MRRFWGVIGAANGLLFAALSLGVLPMAGAPVKTVSPPERLSYAAFGVACWAMARTHRESK